MNKNKKIILTISIIGIIATIIGITVWKYLENKTNNSQQNSQKHKEELYELLKKTDFKIEKDYIQSIKKFEYNKDLNFYHILFKNITNSTFDVYIDDVIKTKIGIGEFNEKKITINFDDTFISKIEKNPEIIKRFFSKIKKWIKDKENFNSIFLQTNIIKNHIKTNTYLSFLFKENIDKFLSQKKKQIIKDFKFILNLTNELESLIKDIKKYNITFDEINEKTNSINLSKDLFNFFDIKGKLFVNFKNISLIKIMNIKIFLTELKKIKNEIQQLINLKIKNLIIKKIEIIFNKIHIKNLIILLINNANFQINLSEKFNNVSFISEYFDYIKTTKKLVLKSEIKNNIKKLKTIIFFLNYLNNLSKEQIINKNKKELERQIQNIILDLNVNKILFFLKKNNALFKKIKNKSKNLKNEIEAFDFKNINKIEKIIFLNKNRTKDKLQSILNFVIYIFNNKLNIKTQLNMELELKIINNILFEANNKVQKLIQKFKKGFLKLNDLRNFTDKEFIYEISFFDENGTVSEIVKKDFKKLKKLKTFIKLIKINVHNLQNILDKNKLVLDINNKLTNEIKQIILRLNTRTNGILGLLNKSENISFNKEDFSIDGSIVTFVIGDKTKEELQFILDFINYIKNNKTDIKNKLNKEEKNKLVININRKLNNEIKQIILRLSTRTNGILELPELSINISFNKEDFLINNSEISFEIDDKTEEKLQSILNFIDYINDNKIKIKQQLDEEDLLKRRKKITLNINEKLTDEVKQIILWLKETDFIWSDFLPNFFKLEHFKLEHFLINNLEISFEMGDKTETKLQSILNVLIYLYDEKENIQEVILRTKLEKKIKNLMNKKNIRLILFDLYYYQFLINYKEENINNEILYLVDDLTEEGKLHFKFFSLYSKKALQSILKFIEYIDNNKKIIRKKILEQQIKDLLIKKIVKQIILILRTRINGILELPELSTDISFNKDDFLFEENQEIFFYRNEKTKEELQSILDFLNYINNKKIEIISQLEKEIILMFINNIVLESQNQVLKLIKKFKDNSLIPSDLEELTDIEFSYKENYFNDNGNISETVKTDLEILKKIKIFLKLIKTNSFELQEILELKKLELDINLKLNNEVKQIIWRLNIRTKGIIGLPNKPKNIYFYKDDFIFRENQEVSFSRNKKTKEELQSILEFINYINDNKTNIKIQLDEEDFFKNKKALELDINTKLIYFYIRKIFFYFKKDNSLISVLPSDWNNEKKNLFKEFIFKDNLEIEFKMGEKTEEELQSILEFITYIYINEKTILNKIILKQIEDIIFGNEQEVQKIIIDFKKKILKSSDLINLFFKNVDSSPNPISSERKRPIYDENYFNDDGSISEIVKTNFVLLRQIKIFVSWIQINLVKLYEILDNKKIQLDINEKLTDEIQQIISRIKARTNGIEGLPNKFKDLKIFIDFSTYNLKTLFLISEKTKEELQFILNFINYINDNKTEIIEQLNIEKNIKNINDILFASENKVKKIVQKFKNGLLKLDELTSLISIEFSYEENYFDNEGNISEITKTNLEILKKIKIFVELVNQKKDQLQEILDKNKLVLNINEKLTNEIQKIIFWLSKRFNGMIELSIISTENKKINFNKDDFLISDSTVSFLMGEKTKEELQFILDFLNYINDNKANIINRINRINLLEKIEFKLTNKVQQIIIDLNKINSLISILPDPSDGSYVEKTFYNQFLIIDSTVSFEMGEKSKIYLQSILKFINYLNKDNEIIQQKINIRKNERLIIKNNIENKASNSITSDVLKIILNNEKNKGTDKYKINKSVEYLLTLDGLSKKISKEAMKFLSVEYFKIRSIDDKIKLKNNVDKLNLKELKLILEMLTIIDENKNFFKNEI